MRLRWMVLGAGLGALLAGGPGVWGQAASPTALIQCQSVVRVKQELLTYTENLAASLVVRAEKAEQELVLVKQQLEAVQPAAPKEKE